MKKKVIASVGISGPVSGHHVTSEPSPVPSGFVEFRDSELRCETCGYTIRYPVPYFNDDEAFRIESERRGAGFRELLDATGWTQRSGIAAMHREDCTRQRPLSWKKAKRNQVNPSLEDKS